MSIFDIKIHEITQQYFDYIKVMKDLDMEVAGEFVAMAATLLQIKSRMLLPQYDEHGEIIEQEDPRKELVQRLLEYQQFQEAAQKLYERPLVGRDMWVRGVRERLDVPDEEIVLEDNALYSLISMFRRVMRSSQRRLHKVGSRAQSIASRILEIKDRLIVGHKIIMTTLVSALEGRRSQLLITFLSVLELAKMGFVSLYQTENYGDIFVESLRPVELAAISKVEEYDNINSQPAELLGDQAPASDMEAATEETVPLLQSEGAAHEELSLSLMFEKEDDGLEVDPNDIATDEEIRQAEQELAAMDQESPNPGFEPETEV